jgi:YVTN family beta-propeller protein
MCFRFTSLVLSVLLTIVLLTACQPATSIPTAPITDAQTATPIVPLEEAPTSDQDRIGATLEVPSPSNRTSGDGLLWIISGSSIVRIDPQTDQVVGDPIQPGIQLEDIAFGGDALWVTTVASGDLGAPSDVDAVSRIDPQSGEVVATIKVSRGPMSVAFTPEAIWVVNFGMSGDTVIRIDPQTDQIAGEPIQTGRAPLSVAVGEGSLWVANHDAHTITRIDLATNQIVANINVTSEPHRVAYGEGSVWVANFHINSVTRIDPQKNQVIGEPIPIGHPAGNMAAGLGSVWVTSDYRGPVDADPEDVVLVRIDPQTNEAVETIPLGGHPIDVEIAGDAVWVSIQGPNKVLRINP